MEKYQSLLVYLLMYGYLLLYARFVLGCAFRKLPLLLSFLAFTPNLIGALTGNGLLQSFADLCAPFGVFALLKLVCPQAKLSQLLFAFLYIDCTISIPQSLIHLLFGDLGVYGAVWLSIAGAVIWCLIFVSKLRYKLREIITATPTSVLAVTCLLLVIMSWQNSSMTMLPSQSEAQGTTSGLIQDIYDAEVKLESEAFDRRMQSLELIGMELVMLVGFSFYLAYAASYSRVKVENAVYEQQIQAQAGHYKDLSEANAEVRRFRHDFKNVLFAIERLLSEGKNKEALLVMRDFSDVLNENSQKMMAFDTGNGIADALLSDKLRRAARENIGLVFRGAIPQTVLEPTDLCVLLGNTVDNAIEACEKLPDGMERMIEIEANCSSGFFFLTVRNPIARAITIRDNRVPTSKKDRAQHGFGIQSLHDVAKKYDGSVKLTADDGYFTVSMDLCIPLQ